MQHRRAQGWDDKTQGSGWHPGALSYKPFTRRISNADVELDKAGFHHNKEKKTVVYLTQRAPWIVRLDVARSCRTMNKGKGVLVNVYEWIE